MSKNLQQATILHFRHLISNLTNKKASRTLKRELINVSSPAVLTLKLISSGGAETQKHMILCFFQ
jgi:hypothetical protein